MGSTHRRASELRFLRRERVPVRLEGALLEVALSALPIDLAHARVVGRVVVWATLATLACRALTPLLAHLAVLLGAGGTLGRAHLVVRDARFLLERALLALALLLLGACVRAPFVKKNFLLPYG